MVGTLIDTTADTMIDATADTMIDTTADTLIVDIGAVALHVDRLVGSVHQHERLVGFVRDAGLSHAQVAIAARGLLLAGPVSLDDLAEVERALPPGVLVTVMEDDARRGLVAYLGGGEMAELPFYTATARGRAVLLRLTALQGEVAAALWASAAGALPALASTATRIVGHALATLPLAPYRAFRLQQAVPAPFADPPAHLLLTHLIALRALHADAWDQTRRRHGLDAAQARALAALRRADTPSQATGPAPDDDGAERALSALRARRLASNESGAGTSRRPAAPCTPRSYKNQPTASRLRSRPWMPRSASRSCTDWRGSPRHESHSCRRSADQWRRAWARSGPPS